MHLLAAQAGAISDGSEAIDLGQRPGEIVVISAADTELACISKSLKVLKSKYLDFPTLRLANLMQLAHHMSVDLYVETIIAKAKIVVVRVLGGRTYWPYGIDEIVGVCLKKGIPVAFLPGDDHPDIELAELSTLQSDALYRIWQYQVHGGLANAEQMLAFLAYLIGYSYEWQEPKPLVKAGLYWPGEYLPDLNLIKSHWIKKQPVVGLIFYRALIQAANIKVVDDFVLALIRAGLNPFPMFTQSLKDPVAAAILELNLYEARPEIILNATGFSVSPPGRPRVLTPFETGREKAAPLVIQVVFSGSDFETWKNGSNGLSPRDISMNVALPEVDGRIFSRAVSFKSFDEYDDITQSKIVRYESVLNRIEFVCDLAKSWVKLRRTAKKDRRVALLFANYPNRDGRLGNGVGLDTPAGSIEILYALAKAGYDLGVLPETSQILLERLKAGPTNNFNRLLDRQISETFMISEYRDFFTRLPFEVQNQVINRWGEPESDPFYYIQENNRGGFALPAYRIGKVIIGLQPARGYNINPKETYHSPDLVPPHNYFAFYAWLQSQVDAVVHMGKHGNLEWLPGKSLALSEECYPEAVLGSLPNIYPFIVNDPGEGTQAKRRASAVIIDHLTPPLARAEAYGPLRDLEQLVDEYFEASGVDPRRLSVLKTQILSLCQVTGIKEDCGILGEDTSDNALSKLDNYLCELKEMQIRDGLHIFGKSPDGDLLDSLLLSLVRVPRNEGLECDESLIRALSKDLELEFDPLDCVMGSVWKGGRPKQLELNFKDPWRTTGDTVERLEILARGLVSGSIKINKAWKATKLVLNYVQKKLKPIVKGCGDSEIYGILRALDGVFVEPGPSGAPTRGRLDVLPTGRNFYSIDTRTIPTFAAWTLGWKSASLLIERYLQDNGVWPKKMGISVWGTSNMRTGGDDIAQALALLGVKPTWDSSSRRVNGFEILPVSILGRPRIDVTLRISGFFRDAFPQLIDFFDSAVRAIGALSESESDNPISAHINDDMEALIGLGVDKKEANRRAGYRIFGSKPGAYGAGLQAMIDEKGWETDQDLAKVYIAWGGYAYGGGSMGDPEHAFFEKRLKSLEAVVHNQDNREHDLLDSDDYYQFEGGMTAAVRHLSGVQPITYHNDHSRPQSPKIRTLEDEIARVIRSRVVNPKWIDGVLRHGYKGAFEIAATVDYLFAFAVTAKCVKNHHFDAVFDAYIVDEKVRKFLESQNPDALQEIVERFIEAEDRGIWKTRRNDTRPLLESILNSD